MIPERVLDRIIDAAFVVAMAGVAWLAVFGHRGLALCGGLMALAAALRPGTWRDGFALLAPKRISRPLPVAALAMAAFTLWIAATALWSQTPGAEWLALTVAVAVLSAGALVHEANNATPKRARLFAAMFALTVSAAAGALLFEGLSGGYLRDVTPPVDPSPQRWRDLTALGRGVTAMAPLIFPAAVIIRGLTGSWAVALTPAAALFVAASHFSVFANVAGLIVGAAAFVIAAARPKFCATLMASLFIASLTLSPFVAVSLPADAYLEGNASLMPASWEQRLVVWKEAGDRALNQCMPLGCGADYARAWSGEGGVIDVPASALPLPVMPIHPHNIFIQVWLELGLPGVFLVVLAFAASGRGLARARIDAMTMAAVCGAAAFSFVSVMLEASLWQVWRLAVFALAAFGCAVSYSVNKSKQ